MLIVGCFGLASNLLGLLLFHDHGHSHGGGHSHGNHAHGSGTIKSAEEGRSEALSGGLDRQTAEIANEHGNIANVLPQAALGGWQSLGASRRRDFTRSDEDTSTAAPSSPLSIRKSRADSVHVKPHRRQSVSRRHTTVDDIHVHPANFRNDIIAASRLQDDSDEGTESEDECAVNPSRIEEEPTSETSPLLAKSNVQPPTISISHHRQATDPLHSTHTHRQPRSAESSGHSHADLNMRGVFLHVMGDALGNVGVIASALFIWLTPFWWRYYSDPAISLVITVIILASAIPLCRAASRILLQGVPSGLSIDDLQHDIESLPGVLGCHHVHVWQLSDTKLVASLHVQVQFDFEGEGSARYMALARSVRTCLHEYGIHSSTIQPEFCLDREHNHSEDGADEISAPHDPRFSRAGSVRSAVDACLLDCDEACGDGGQCCAPDGDVRRKDGDGGDGHGHVH